MPSRLRPWLLPGAALTAIVAGLVLRAGPATSPWGPRVWLAGLALTGVPLVVGMARHALAGRFAVDVIAALAVVGALWLGEPLAGLVVVLMQSGGEALERMAEGRASEAVRALEAAAPRIAHRRLPDGREETIPVEQIAVGDLLHVLPGELLPADGEVADGTPTLDTSRITGEPLPVTVHAGQPVASGTVNGASPFLLRATRPAQESQYARIVALVREAQRTRAPLQRLADRAAVWFTPLTLAVGGLAWAASGDARRMLAVLVVATPCPLILATPVALIGGINRAARRGIIVRHGQALEALSRVTEAFFDKTGTLTAGRPSVTEAVPIAPVTRDELLAEAAAVERGSGHPFARSVVEAAAASAVPARRAEEVVEIAGRGALGRVAGARVVVGSPSLVHDEAPQAAAVLAALQATADGTVAWVARDAQPLGVLHFADRLRDGIPGFLRRLHALGVRQIAMLSGDAAANAEMVATAVGIDRVHGDLRPDDKVRIVRTATAAGRTTLMVGDGTNDAPALAAATVGVAMGRGGSGIAAEAADVVLLTDDVTVVADAIAIGRDTLRIARQSLWLGLGLSAGAMVVAAFGYLPPTMGALLQEAIDVAAILNALRAANGHSA